MVTLTTSSDTSYPRSMDGILAPGLGDSQRAILGILKQRRERTLGELEGSFELAVFCFWQLHHFRSPQMCLAAACSAVRSSCGIPAADSGSPTGAPNSVHWKVQAAR